MFCITTSLETELASFKLCSKFELIGCYAEILNCFCKDRLRICGFEPKEYVLTDRQSIISLSSVSLIDALVHNLGSVHIFQIESISI